MVVGPVVPPSLNTRDGACRDPLKVHVAGCQLRHIRPCSVCLINQFLLDNTKLVQPVGGLFVRNFVVLCFLSKEEEKAEEKVGGRDGGRREGKEEK